MAQRRSKNRRLSRRSGNLSGFLDDNTNTIDNDDPQWHDRTILRPSTSFVLTKRTNSILNPDSMADETHLSSDWYNNLSRSENSKLMEKITKNKVNNQNSESENNTLVEPITESESETESQRKRTKLRINKKKVNVSDKSNMFLKALEKTTESHTKDLTVQMPEECESESTNDDSRTIKKARPALFRNNKLPKENMSNFDDVFHSNSTENVLTNTRNTRSFLKRKSKELIERTSTPEKTQKFKKTQQENLVEISSTVNETLDKTLLVTPLRELRNRSIIKSTSKTPMKLSQKQAGSVTIYDSVDMSLTMEENKLQKKRTVIFSKKLKKDNSKNLFDEIFDKSSLENELVIERSSAKMQEQKADGVNNEPEYDESETSSIPKYIRRTRSVVPRKSSTDSEDKNVFNSSTRDQRDREHTNNNESAASHQSSERSQDDKISQRSPKSSQNINKSPNLSTTQNKLTNNKVLNKNNKTVPNISFNEKDNENSSRSKIIDTTKTHMPEKSVDDEYIFDRPESSNSRIQTFIQTLDKSKRSKKSSNTSLQKSTCAINDVDEPADNELSNTITSDMTNKSRLRSSIRASKNLNNTFNKILNDENSAAFEKSNLMTPNDTETSSRTFNKSVSNRSQNISEIHESIANESIHNNSQQEESEDETSTIPNHIRRTRSRLFQRSEVAENNTFDNILNAENSEVNNSSKSNRSQSQKSLNLKLDAAQKSNQALNRNTVKPNNFTKPISQVFEKLHEIQQRVESPKASYTSTESLKENQEFNKFEKLKSKKSNTPINKSKELINNAESLSVKENSSRKNLTITSNKSKKYISQKSKTVDINIEANTSSKEVPNQHSSTQISSDGTPEARLHKSRKILNTSGKLVNDDYLSDDILHTPNPAQSTLKKTGKPLTRITQFLFNNSAADKTNSPQSISSNRNLVQPSTDPKVSNSQHRPILQKAGNNNEEDEDLEIDVLNHSDVSEHFELVIPIAKQALDDNNDSTASTISESEWIKIKKKTDALKVIMEAQRKQQDAIQHKRECEKARIEAKLKRIIAQRSAELKRQSKKPIHKAYYVDGKLYKQPMLPAPKKWVTDRLYKYLWKHMESKFGIRTRVMSEKFVLKLSDIFTVVVRRKKYENYKAEVNDLMIRMAKLGLIKNRYDFYGFCREFMPYPFRIKVIPMLMPGNERNIPYEPELVYTPILPD